ncbi:uncharacterized protein [Amphiura filiformis]|uniref:uncharacterized protein n=1 Tax=Amphiura filiformis TaxID=82378 RepID=UPI003B20CC5A
MNGCVIAGTPIAVDFWQIRQKSHLKIFFLSHMHGDHTKGLSASWRRPIYCSPVTARLLPAKLNVPASLVKPLEVGESHIIPLDETGQETMTVSLIDANHCPGAVMFLFEGYFGRILYTGDFRYQPSMITDTILSNCGQVDKLYLDNTYNNPNCIWPNRSECTAKIIDIILQYPAYEVVIGIHKLGKEELLVDIALALKMRIVVNPDRLKTMKILQLPDVFTTDSSQSRIRTVLQHLVRKKNLSKWQESAPTIVILPTALYTSLDMDPYANNPDIHVVPYSDHSSYSELIEFVSHVKPKSITPVVAGGGGFDMGNGDMTVFDPYLTKSKDPGESSVTIPESVLKYMNSASISSFHLAKNAAENSMKVKQRKAPTVRKNSVKDLPKGVVFNDSIEEDLTEEFERRRECEQHRKTANLSQDSQSGKDTLTQSMNPSQNKEGCSGDSTSDLCELSPKMLQPKVVNVSKESVGSTVLQQCKNSECNVKADICKEPPNKKPRLDVYTMLLASALRRKSFKESICDQDEVVCLKMTDPKSADTKDKYPNLLSQQPSENVPSMLKEDQSVEDLTLIPSKQTCDERSQVSVKNTSNKSTPEKCKETGTNNSMQNSIKMGVSEFYSTTKSSNLNRVPRNSISNSRFLKLPYSVRPTNCKRTKKMDPVEIFKHFLQKQ